MWFYADTMWQSLYRKGLVWDLAARCTHCYCGVFRICIPCKSCIRTRAIFREDCLSAEEEERKKKRRVRKGKRLNLPLPVKHSGEWQDSIHCKWKTAMKSERGRLARAVKPLLYLMLLKVDPSLAFDWQQIVSKSNCVGHNFQLGKRVRERYLSSLPDRPSEDNFNPKKKKRGDTGGWVSKVYFQKITEVWKSGKSRCLKRFICIKQSGPPLVIKNSKQQHLWMH